MQIRTRVLADVQLIDLDGILRLGAGELALRTTVRRLLDEGHPKLVLNLRDLIHVDSAGLGEMIASKKAAVDHGGDLKLLTPQRSVRDLLSLSRLTEIFGIYDDESEAVGSF